MRMLFKATLATLVGIGGAATISSPKLPPATTTNTAAAPVSAGILGYQTGPAAQDVQRCQTVQGAVDHYEVTYNYRGSVRTAQMSAPPANNRIVVNERGEPRM